MGFFLHISLQLANHKSQRSDTLKQELSTAKTYEHNRLNETSIVDRHRCHMAAKFGLFVDEDHIKLPTLYWLPKLHKRPYKSRFIANSSACTTTELSIRLTSCLTAIKNHVIKYCTTVYERNGKNLFWSIKISGEILNKLKSRGFLASRLSTYGPGYDKRYLMVVSIKI